MGRKAVMGKGKRTVLQFAAVLMTALAAGCAAAVYANSFITVEGTEGTASYFVSPLAQKELFEESEIFDDLFDLFFQGKGLRIHKSTLYFFPDIVYR